MHCKLLKKNDPIELIIALLHLWCMYIYKVLCNRVQTETLVDFYNESLHLDNTLYAGGRDSGSPHLAIATSPEK